MAFNSLTTFYTGLVLIAMGTGLLKPNISTMVGSLYSTSDERRDAGFSIFYMGINIGAFISPLVTGYLAQSNGWKSAMSWWGLDPTHSWHWGFAAAGVGMTFGLVAYVLQRNRLSHVGTPPHPTPALARFFLRQALWVGAATLVLLALVPWVRRLMGGIR